MTVFRQVPAQGADLPRVRAALRSVRLSPREREITVLIAQGLPTKAIGAALEISTWTVATYLRRIYARFGVRSRAAMVARLIDEGLLVPESPSSPDARAQSAHSEE